MAVSAMLTIRLTEDLLNIDVLLRVPVERLGCNEQIAPMKLIRRCIIALPLLVALFATLYFLVSPPPTQQA